MRKVNVDYCECQQESGGSYGKGGRKRQEGPPSTGLKDMQRLSNCPRALGVSRREAQSHEKPPDNQDCFQQRVENGFNSDRSGDVIVVTAPYTFFSDSKTGTTHGSPYEYDTPVPLLFFGLGVKPGEYDRACAPNDISATLAYALGIPKPDRCAGNMLSAMFGEQRPQ